MRLAVIADLVFRAGVLSFELQPNVGIVLNQVSKHALDVALPLADTVGVVACICQYCGADNLYRTGNICAHVLANTTVMYVLC